MNFPPISGILSSYNFFLLTGPFCIGLCIFCLLRFIRFRKTGKIDPKEKKAGLPQGNMNLLFAIVTLLIGSAHLLVYVGVFKSLEFRKINITNIKCIEATLVDKSGKASKGDVKIISDPATIQNGLKLLSAATSYTRSHETYSEGYLLHLVEKQPSDSRGYYIAVFRKSSRIGKASIVIPFVGSQDDWDIASATQGGEYSCPDFIIWVKSTVDPLFYDQPEDFPHNSSLSPPPHTGNIFLTLCAHF